MFKVGDEVQLTEDACAYYGNDKDYRRDWGVDENDLALSLFTISAVNRNGVHNIPCYTLVDGVPGGSIGVYEFDLELAP